MTRGVITATCELANIHNWCFLASFLGMFLKHFKLNDLKRHALPQTSCISGVAVVQISLAEVANV